MDSLSATEENPGAGSDAGARDNPGSDAEQLGRLVRYVASQLVDDPEEIEVDVDDRGSSAHITLIVPEEQMGRVIGRQGRIARAMRAVVMIAGSRRNLRASLDIEEQYESAPEDTGTENEPTDEAEYED